MLSFIGIGAMKWAAVLSFVTVAIVAAQWGVTQLRGLRTPRTPEREPTANVG